MELRAPGFLLALLWSLASSATGFALRKFEAAPKQMEMRLRNVGDTDYLCTIDMGDHSIEAILDTASFDIVVFSAECANCRGTGLYNHQLSSSYEKGTITKDTYYGSGSTHSREAFEKMSLCPSSSGINGCTGGFSAERQFFWEVLESNLDFDVGEEWQMILGLGPPGGSVKLAAANLEDAQQQYAALNGIGTERMEEALHEAEAVADHAKLATSFIENMKLQYFSICFGKMHGSSGLVVWNDVQPSSGAFHYVPVVSDLYWASVLTNVRLQGDDEVLGCEFGVCNGLVDSGTTLLAAQSSFVSKLTSKLMKWRAEGGDCSDMSTLPSLQFQLGGQSFELPPSSYMGKVVGTLNLDDLGIMQVLPHLQHIKDLPRSSHLGEVGAVGAYANDNAWEEELKAAMWANFSASCVPLLMTIDEDSGSGPMWILGAPFFREYYSTFALKEQPIAGRYAAEGMYFAKAGEDCHPEANSGESQHSLVEGLHLDISRLRLPPNVRYPRKAGLHFGDWRFRK